MPRIVYVQPDGSRNEVDIKVGYSVMEGATSRGIPGIMADCGGQAVCATCLVTMDEDWLARSGQRTPDEIEMLDVAENAGPNSRLSCQIVMREDLDGLTVHIPAEQG